MQAQYSGEDVLVTRICPMCHKLAQVTVPAKGYHAWMNGTLIQNALPMIPKELREVLITGIHDDCWKKMFGSGED